MRQLLSIPVCVFLALNPVLSGVAEAATPGPTTPIQHVVVIFDENVSFDHYFGTYPNAANTDGTTFTAAAGTKPPLNLEKSKLLTKNPNEYNPTRLSSTEP